MRDACCPQLFLLRILRFLTSQRPTINVQSTAYEAQRIKPYVQRTTWSVKRTVCIAQRTMSITYKW